VSVALIRRPGSDPLRVLATHFHQVDTAGETRDEEAHFLAERFGALGPTLLLGDFNAEPDARCLEILREAGWSDVAGAAARTEPTFPSAAPERRIDTIFFGSGLVLRSAEVAPAWGSDHRAVVADFAAPPDSVARNR
jgi:endonuclease/exonuclease/phosphatase family metal-dependent hydrolase